MDTGTPKFEIRHPDVERLPNPILEKNNDELNCVLVLYKLFAGFPANTFQPASVRAVPTGYSIGDKVEETNRLLSFE